MSVFTLPLLKDATPFYEQRTQLDGIDYVFSFAYNERRALWTFNIVGPDDEAVISGQSIYIGVDLLRRSVAISRPPGLLTALSENGDVSTADLEALGNRVNLYYFDAEELGIA